jgi:hypothetical protein
LTTLTTSPHSSQANSFFPAPDLAGFFLDAVFFVFLLVMACLLADHNMDKKSGIVNGKTPPLNDFLPLIPQETRGKIIDCRPDHG